MKPVIRLLYLIISLLIIFLSNNKCTQVAGASYDNSCQSRNFLIISTIDGVVTALDANTGKKCWSVVLNAEKFLSSSISQVEIYENNRRIWLVPSLDGGIYKYDNFRKAIQPLPFDVDSLINQPFLFDPLTSVIGGKVKLLYGINSLTGEIVYVCKKDGCTTLVSSFPGNILIVEEITHFVNAIDSSKAEQKWHFHVSEVMVKLAAQVPSANSFAFKNGTQKNALIPRNYQDFVNVDISMYKISLQNGFTGMLNKTTQAFSWSFQASCPITDVWFVKDTIVKSIDPFNSESGFFSIDIDDGQYFTLLFLGSFENQLFIKKSKHFSAKETTFNSLSRMNFYESHMIPVCSKSENNVAHSSSFSREDLNPSLSFNVTDYGTYFYINYTVIENKTHCVINTTYTVKYESSSTLSYQIFAIYLVTCTMTCIMFLIVFPRFIHNTLKKEYSNLRKTFEPQLSSSDKEFRSRFHQDFEYLSTLGRGGFGVVMDVKNKIDDCRYAVKRIRLHEQLNKTQYKKVLREVKALAKLDHHGIVRYFNAWTEYPPMGWQEEKDKEFKISDCGELESEVNSSSVSLIESSTSQKPPSKRKKAHSLSEYISKSKKQKVSKVDIKMKLNQNPLAVFEDDLLNVDLQQSETTLPENQDRNYDSFFYAHTKTSESEQSTSNEDSCEESNHDSQFLQDREESSDSFSVVFEAPNKTMNHEDNILEKYTDSKRSHESIPNKIACKEDSSLLLQNREESNDSFSVVFEASNKSMSHEDNILAKYTDSKSSHESIPNKIDCKEDSSLKVKCPHVNCLSVLKSLNEKVIIYKLNSENFDVLCVYFFHDESSSGISVTERSDWKETVQENVFIYKTSFQRWLLCILCLIRSTGDSVCPSLIINLCYILSDVNKSLSSMKNGFKLPERQLHRRPTVHFLKRDSKQSDSTKQSISSFPRKSKASTKSFKDIPRGYLYIQMQLCQRDSLRDWLDVNNKHRDYDKVMDIFSQIVEAVHYVHNCGLMHRDLKPSNIYFSLEGAIKIGDFGLATSSEIHDANVNNAIRSFTHTSDIGTEIYMSPEQKKKQDYDYKTDIYSLGIILFELLVPFRTVSERFKVLLQVRQHKFPENFMVEYVKESELLSNLLNDDPASRPTTDEIKEKLMLIKLP